ncbi:MAG: ketoacyl-ACP synthase III [Brevundimonas sp.]|nr:MAG: ketoacyl-ACP synthase III [Brevundimonas sp.]
MPSARISGIAYHLPERVLDNVELASLSAGWTPEKILDKTGVATRRIVADGETAGDLAEAAARRLFAQKGVDPADIDHLIFCSQTPDYRLPATACVLQDRLGLPTHAGAFDMSIGCSGFVYGLGVARGLVETGQARRVLLLNADAYSTLLRQDDLSVRALFGDGAAATLIEAANDNAGCIGAAVYGSDGSGAGKLIVPGGGAREPGGTPHLSMDGAAVMAFALKEGPAAVARLLEQTGAALDDFDLIVPHQASRMVLDGLRRRLGVPPERFVVDVENIGNTVGASIPIALSRLPVSDRPRRILILGFGVGLSWAAADITL